MSFFDHTRKSGMSQTMNVDSDARVLFKLLTLLDPGNELA